MQAPTIADLLKELAVQRALEQAWLQSLPGDALQRHEEGGWIYMDIISRGIVVRRAPAGASSDLGFKHTATRAWRGGGRHLSHPS